MPHGLPDDVRLVILEKSQTSEKSQNFKELWPRVKILLIVAKNA